MPRDTLPLSSRQQSLWFLDQLAAGGNAYVFQADYEVTGPLDVAAFIRAVRYIMRRHEVLRSRIEVVGGTPCAVIAPSDGLAVEQIDVRDSADPSQAALQFMRKQAQQAFDLASGPLFRSAVIRTTDDSWIIHVNAHHAVYDGESHRIFEQELAAAYTSFIAGKAPLLPELPMTYADFAAEQNSWLVGPEAAAEVEYWSQRLAGASEAEIIPDRSRPDVRDFAGNEIAISFPDATSRRVERLARQRRTTTFVTMLAAYQYLLSRYTGSRDVVVGVPFRGRTRPELEPLIGFFVNTLPIRCGIHGDRTFAQLASHVRDVVLAATDHQDLPFERIVAGLALERDTRRNPIFQNWFDIENSDQISLRLDGVGCRRIKRAETSSRFDTEFHIVVNQNGLGARLVYAPQLFERPRMELLLSHYVTLVGSLAENAERKLSEFPVLPAAEAREIIRLGCPAGQADGAGRTVAEWFEETALAAPDAVAVTDGESELTYGELRNRADRVATWLRDNGAGPETIVGVCVPRTVSLVIALLGVVRAGAAYLPIDPELPDGRLRFMLANAGATHVVTCMSMRHLIHGAAANVLCLERVSGGEAADGPLPEDFGPDNALYVLYTSGSTGQPKGVAVTHRSFCNLVQWHLAKYHRRNGENVVSAVANVAFDAAGWEIWPALLSGARLDIVPTETAMIGDGLIRHFARAATTAAFVPTPLAEQLIRTNIAQRTRLRHVLTGGDVFRPQPNDDPGIPVFNHYGPTEATVVATASDALGAPWQDVSIGRAITGVRAYVLDRYLHPVPKGVIGELFIGGAGVSRGYFNRPSMTAERFVPDPFAAASGARMYRTGDTVRWRDNGTLAFIGRMDRQVKVRGLRIEPAEIESVILGFPGVREAVVLVAESGRAGHVLAAYLTARDGEIDTSSLREHLASRLPEYMIPAVFVVVSSMPLSSTGKIDQRRLPALPAQVHSSAAPEGPVEKSIAALWSEVLGTPDVGADDDFFVSGGHSLAAAQLAAMIGDRFGIQLPIRAIFQQRTVAGIGAAVVRKIRDEVSRMSDEEVAAELRGSLLHQAQERADEKPWKALCVNLSLTGPRRRTPMRTPSRASRSILRNKLSVRLTPWRSSAVLSD